MLFRSEDVVLSLVSEMLKAIAEYAKHDRAEFVRVVQEAQSSQQTAEVRKQRTGRNVEHASLGRSLISMAQAPHFRTIQLHSQLMGVTIFPELSFKGVLLFNSFRTLATELFLLPSNSNSCQ